MNVKKIVLMLFLFLCVFTSSCNAFEHEEHAAWKIELCMQLYALKAGNFFENDSEGVLKDNADALESSDAIPAIFEMFFRGEHDIVEMAWWKQENRAARCFAMALYLCATSEGTSWVPEFDLYLERFNDQEKHERKEEQAFILAYRSALAEKLVEILRHRDSEKYNSTFKAYFGTMSNMGIGKDLPNWCQNTME